MKLTPQKFTIESFRDQSGWIGALLSPLNSFMNDLVIAFTGQITVSENLYQEIKEIKFKNVANSLPLRFRTKFNSNPQGLHLIYIYDNTLNEMAALNPAIQWSFSNGEIILSSISGLTASSTYTIRIHVIYG